jgi:hypothetical protein
MVFRRIIMSEEVLRILKMVEEGKIDSEKGTQLIEALNGRREEEGVPVKALPGSNSNISREDLMMKIRVNEKNGNKVNVNLPIKVISGILSATGKLPINMQGVEGVDISGMTEALIQAVNGGMVGKIVDVKSEDGDCVEIIIE